MEIDKTGLEDRMFEIFSKSANERGYLFVCNLDTMITRWSLNAVEYFKMPGEYMYDMDAFWKERMHPDDVEVSIRKKKELLAGHTEWADFEYRIKNGEGEYVVCTCRCTIIKGENGEPDLFSGTVVNRGVEDYVDSVTMLHTNQRLVYRLEQCVREKRTAAVMDIEISKFSRISILYGYEAGNEVLLQLANAMRARVEGHGGAYHLDGAKFVLLLPDYTRDQATGALRGIAGICKNADPGGRQSHGSDQAFRRCNDASGF